MLMQSGVPEHQLSDDVPEECGHRWHRASAKNLQVCIRGLFGFPFEKDFLRLISSISRGRFEVFEFNLFIPLPEMPMFHMTCNISI